MLDFSEVRMQQMVIHHVGNKGREEDLVISRDLFEPKEELVKDLLLRYFLSPFKGDVFYTFHHEEDLGLNELYKFASSVFSGRGDFFLQSANIAERLYDKSEHPRIKGGELYMVYLQGCVVDGEQTDALGIFKSENKETFLKVYSKDSRFDVDAEEGININKLDKGCLIFNTEEDKGFKICIVDASGKNGSEAQYWKDDFLGLKQREDDFYRTQQFIEVCRSFCDDVLTEDNSISRPDQLMVKNKSAEFLKTKARSQEPVSIEEFEQEVMGAPQVIEAFRDYRKDFVKKNDIEDFEETFDISPAAVKKESKYLRAVVKLDKNFHLYIHGSHDRVETGFDEGRRMKYYKLYYEHEE
jgi:hypothetical protein